MYASTRDVFLRMIGGMRRLATLACAIAVAASSLAAGGVALAKDHRDGGGRGEQQRGEAQRGRGGEDGRWGGRGGPPPGWRGEGGGGGRWAGERGERGERGEQRYEPRAAPPDERYAPPPRRGGYLGPQGGAPIEDPGRYRLRPAPRGYLWVRVPGGMAIVSQATGQVFDVVPDRY
jgi:Ni/Co efflux regulator RcnB